MKFGVSIIFSFAFICIGNSALLGANECTYGPAFWCSSIMNAKQCNAVDHCIQTVWEKETLPEDNDDVCKICKDMVKQARDQLLSNETQDEIRQVFEGSCQLIPVPLIKDECIKLSDNFIPELIDTLASRMNPQVVCATAGLCNSIHVDQLLAKHYKLQEKNVEVKKAPVRDCTDCKSFITDIVTKVNSLPRSQVLNQILSVCGQLGSISDGCMSLVQSNFNFIYDFLKNGLHPTEVCEVIGMCKRLYGETVITAPKTEDTPCDFCVAIVNSWRNNFLSNTTKEEFRKILDGVCEHTGKFRQECHALVDQYFEFIYEMLVSDIHPQEICEAVGLCGPNGIFNTNAPVWTIMEMHPQDHLALDPLDQPHGFTGRDEANSYKIEGNGIHLPRVTLTKSKLAVVNLGKSGIITDDSKTLKVVKSDKCVMCEFVLHFLQNVLSDNTSRAEIKNELDQVCTMFPHSIAEQCQDYIDAYGDQLIQLLVLEMDPSQICPLIHMCPGISMFKSMSDDTSCILCQYVMTELDTILDDKSNEAAIRKSLENVCQLMPKSIRPECISFIDMYIDQIIDLIVNDFTPKQICAQIGLCPKNNINAIIDPNLAQLPMSRLFVPLNLVDAHRADAVAEKVTFTTQESSGCILCEFIVTKIDSSLVSNSTEEQIRKSLDQVCLLLPHSLVNDCLGFMEEYSSALVEMLVQRIDPVKICTQLKLCGHHQLSEGMFKAQVQFPFDNCFICEKVMGYIDQKLKDGKVFVDIVSAVINDVCVLLPKETQTKCQDFILKYNDFLVLLLEEMLEPKHVCQFLKVCPKLDSKPLLGANKCTRGPGYWCQSKLHAQACNTLDHCVEKVWMGSVPEF